MPDRFYLLISKKFGETASIAEMEELDTLCSTNNLLRREYQAIEAFWKTRTTTPAKDLQTFENHVKRLKAAGHEFGLMSENSDKNRIPEASTVPISKMKPTKRFGFWAAAAIMLGMVGALLWNSRGGSLNARSGDIQIEEVLNEVQTRPGSRSKMVLPDGSEVWVNASSRLTYDQQFGKTHRNIKLDGEAYFMVSKNKRLPFIIQTRKINITVTGTIFNVRAYENEGRTETALVEGSVQIHLNESPEKIYQLKPSEKLVVNHPMETSVVEHFHSSKEHMPDDIGNKEQITVSSVNYLNTDSVLVETAWLYSTLAFSDESFADIAQKMEKWYGVDIVFESHYLEKLRFTGTFTNETISEALEALRFTAKFKFRRNENRVIIFN